jgi:hypothetical protein
MFQIEQIDRKSFNRALNVLKTMEENVVKDLRKDLRTELQPFASNLASAMPEVAPISGLARYPKYAQPKGSVSLLTGRKGGLVTINLKAAERGFWLAEMAGTVSEGKTNAGKALVRNLNARKPLRGSGKRKPGRYAWPQFRLLLPDAAKRAEEIVLRTLKKLEKDIY